MSWQKARQLTLHCLPNSHRSKIFSTNEIVSCFFFFHKFPLLVAFAFKSETEVGQRPLPQFPASHRLEDSNLKSIFRSNSLYKCHWQLLFYQTGISCCWDVLHRTAELCLGFVVVSCSCNSTLKQIPSFAPHFFGDALERNFTSDSPVYWNHHFASSPSPSLLGSVWVDRSSLFPARRTCSLPSSSGSSP